MDSDAGHITVSLFLVLLHSNYIQSVLVYKLGSLFFANILLGFVNFLLVMCYKIGLFLIFVV